MLKKQYNQDKAVCTVTFTLPVNAINTEEVRVLGEFNNWAWNEGVKMEKQAEQFVATVDLPVGEHQFRYCSDNGIWENDCAADAYIPTPFGVTNSVVFVETAEIKEKIDLATKSTTSKKATKAEEAQVEMKAKVVVKEPVQEKVAETTTKAKAKPAKRVAKTTKRVVGVTKRVKKDDLKKIEGIGPKIASLLKEEGIATFKELEKAKLSTLEQVLKNAGPRFKMHKPTTWSEQAALAAAGKWEELETLQDELKGGLRK